MVCPGLRSSSPYLPLPNELAERPKLLPPEIGATGEPPVVGEHVVLRLGHWQPAEMEHDPAEGLPCTLAPRIEQGRGPASLANASPAALASQHFLRPRSGRSGQARIPGRDGLVEGQHPAEIDDRPIGRWWSVHLLDLVRGPAAIRAPDVTTGTPTAAPGRGSGAPGRVAPANRRRRPRPVRLTTASGLHNGTVACTSWRCATRASSWEPVGSV